MKLMTVLSLGAGVQSTTLALMATHNLIPKPDYAIFADTGWESQQTLEHLKELSLLIDFPIVKASNGNLLEDTINGLSLITDYFTKLPFFLLNGGIGKRQCTSDYKIVPIKRKVRELIGAGVRTRLYDDYVEMQIGISLDECDRMSKSRVEYIKHVYPLLDLRMTREDCEKWLIKHGYKIPPKSACVGCPFHSDATWQYLKSDCKAEFDVAVEVDELLRTKQNEFMHKSLLPLDRVIFKTNRKFKQVDLFSNECSGLCNL